jgi:hypothetical protein
MNRPSKRIKSPNNEEIGRDNELAETTMQCMTERSIGSNNNPSECTSS